MTDKKELNEEELEQVNGGCNPNYDPNMCSDERYLFKFHYKQIFTYSVDESEVSAHIGDDLLFIKSESNLQYFVGTVNSVYAISESCGHNYKGNVTIYGVCGLDFKRNETVEVCYNDYDIYSCRG